MQPLIAILVASLAGSLHCAGMCGALVAFAVGAENAPRRTLAMLHIAYHGGRLITYSLLGAVCGLLGAALDLGGSLLGLQSAAAFLAGGMMILVGVIAILRYSGVRIGAARIPRFWQNFIAIGQRAAAGFRPLPRAFIIGLLTTFLPCGWLYAFAIIATGAGSALWGAAIMAAFWVGTVPVLVFVGAGVQTLTATLGRRVPLVTAVLVAALGVYTVATRAAISATTFRSLDNTATQPNAVERVSKLDQSGLPCCQEDGD